MSLDILSQYKYRGAGALVILHEQHLNSLVQTWKRARKKNIVLPETTDTDYESLETLLHHILRAARGYMNWMCEKLELPDPGIDPAPGAEKVNDEIDNYLKYLLDKWRQPLMRVEPKKFDDRTFPARWGPEYCIDAMLEHAVMHPIRHEFQLKNLMAEEGS